MLFLLVCLSSLYWGYTSGQAPFLKPPSTQLQTLELANYGVYDVKLPCGACVNQDFVYCRLGTNEQELVMYPSLATSICCRDDTCPHTSFANYTCSHVYGNKLLAKKVCPYVKNVCGGTVKRNIVLEN